MLPQIAASDRKELTDMQQAFVAAFVRNHGDKEQAAIDAGYSKRSAREQAYELLRKPHVLHAILEASVAELISSAPKAISRLHDLMEARSEYVALQASQDVLDRLGLKSAEKHDHRVAGDISVQIDLTGGG